MKYFVIVISFLCLCSMFSVQTCKADVSNAFIRYEENTLPEIHKAIQLRDFQTVHQQLKNILLDDRLTKTEKTKLLEKSSVYAKNLGNFREAGEILELLYAIIPNAQKEKTQEEAEEYHQILTLLHEKLVSYYQSIRHWEKVNEAHFHYLSHIPLEHEEKMDILFDVVSNYFNMLAFKKAGKVLEEIGRLCQSKRDFSLFHYYRGLALFSQNEYEKTREAHKKALEYHMLEDDELGMAYYQLGICHEILQDRQKAVEYYEKAMPLYQNKRVVEKRLQKLSGQSMESNQ